MASQSGESARLTVASARPPDMPYTPITAEDMAGAHPSLFRTTTPKPGPSFAEQHAFALAVNTARQPLPPAACSLLAARMAAGKASNT